MQTRAKSKRKKSSSPNSGRVIKPKKAKVNINPVANNPQVFVTAPTTQQSLPATSQSRPATSQSSPGTSQSVPTTPNQNPVAGKTIKPVFVQSGFQVIRNVIQSVQFSSKPLLKVRGSNSTQVLCCSVDDKKKLIAKLQSEQIGYHTFTDQADKPTYFLLKGFYQAPCVEVLSMLQAAAVPAKKVTDFIRNDNFVIYLAPFDKSININLLNHSHKHVDGIVVKWDVLRKSNKKVTQCFRCQQWGHSAVNCGLTPRCVKCNEAHDKGACPRTTREGDPTCCNCGGPHASNHRGCPVYKQHLEKIKARSKKPSTTVLQRDPVPLDSMSHFPRLSTQQNPVSTSRAGVNTSQSVSFASKFSESNNSVDIFTKLTQAQDKLKSLPNINKTIDIFIRMVDELSACNDQNGQINILIKYTSFSKTSNGS